MSRHRVRFSNRFQYTHTFLCDFNATFCTEAVDAVCPIFSIYENVKGATERMSDGQGGTRRPAIETVAADAHSMGYNFVSWFIRDQK